MEQREQICANCENAFSGKYCPACGEKVTQAKDFSLGAIFSQALETIFTLDSKLLRSLIAMFVRPGKIAALHIQGIRVPYVKPIQLFVLANLLFYLILARLDVFRIPSVWYFSENGDGINVVEKVENIMAAKNLTWETVAQQYDKLSTNFSKLGLVLVVPFLALVAKLINWRKEKVFGMHFIFALQELSFMLYFSVFWTGIGAIFRVGNGDFYRYPIFIAVFVHYFLALKRFYQDKWWIAFLKSILGIFLVLLCIATYRFGVSWLSLWWVGW